jgi:hypothetical protein
MYNIISVRQGRSRPFFYWIFVLLVVFVLAACSAPGEPEVPAVVARETPIPTATEPVEVEPAEVETVEAESTDAEPVDPAPTEAAAPEPTEPGAIPQKGRLPMEDEVVFEIAAQYGGVSSAVAVDGDIAYVGFGPRLMTIDVSDPADPQMLGETDLLADNIRDIAVQNDMAYLAAGRAGLAIVDVSDAANPAIVNEGPNYAGANPAFAESLQVEGNMIFVGDFYSQEGVKSLLHFSINGPGNVVLVNGYEIQVNDMITVNNGRVLIVGNGRIEVRSTAEPGTIQGRTTLAGGDYSSQVIVQGDRAYVMESGTIAGVEVFDISDPTSPKAVTDIYSVQILFTTKSVSDGSTIYSVGTFGEFGFCDSQIYTIDITGDEPVNGIQLSPEICVTDLYVSGDYLFVTGRSGLKIFDVSDLSSMQTMSLFGNPDGFHTVEAVAQHEDVTYILSGEGSGADLRVLDLDGETAELYADVLPLSMVVSDLFVAGDTLVAPQWQGSFFIFDLTDSTVPQLLYSPEDGTSFSTGDIFNYYLDGDILYVPLVDGTLIGGVGVVDLSDPANPEIIATFEMGDYQVMHMVGGNGYLYILSQGEASHINIFDISDPSAPEHAGQITMPEYTNRLALVGETLYAVCDKWNCQSLFSLDVSDPASVEVTGQWEIFVGAGDLAPVGEGLFLMSTYGEGVFLLNLSDPENPYLAGHIQLPGDYSRLKVQGDTIYAAVYDGGLFIIDIE